MIKHIRSQNTAFEIDDHPGNSKKILSNPGDKLILPIDSGCRFGVEENFPDILGTRAFNSRELTLGMIMLERSGNYLALAPTDTLSARCTVIRNSGNLLEAEITAQCEIIELTGELPQIIEAYRKLRSELRVTLAEKKQKLPGLDRLTRSAIIYVWHNDYEKLMYSNKDEKVKVDNPGGIVRIAEKLKDDGLSDLMFGIFFKSDQAAVNKLRDLGFMASKYDNYNDVPPVRLCDILPKTRIDECDYLSRRVGDHPGRILTSSTGTLATAWQLDGLDGKRHSQYTMCPLCAVEAMKKEIPEEIANADYAARFIDVFGTGLSECHSPAHPFTRRESVGIKRSAFEYLTSIGLIPGTEDGCEILTPALCYNEGMASPVFFRRDFREAGRRKARLYETKEDIEWFRKYMVDPEHRFPLWELCWRDSVISFPYWGDSLLCCPEIVRERILLAALFAEPPLYSFFEKDFKRLENLIVTSYKRIREVLLTVGDLPMTDFSKPADKLYRSEFGGKFSVVANFSTDEQSYDKTKIAPLDFTIIQ